MCSSSSGDAGLETHNAQRGGTQASRMAPLLAVLEAKSPLPVCGAGNTEA